MIPLSTGSTSPGTPDAGDIDRGGARPVGLDTPIELGVQGVPIEVLLVEDNPGDVRLTQEGFREGRLRNNLHVTMDGEEALAFLNQEGDHADAPRPDLVLLDLNLPKIDGHEVLRRMKEDAELKGIPVVILTTSSQEADIRRAYENQASSFITKPVNFDKFVDLVRDMGIYWFAVVKLPR